MYRIINHLVCQEANLDKTAPKRKYDLSRRKNQARQTRRQIIQAALKLFTERGYSGATIDAIAQEAGVALETVYAVFGNKLTILAAVVDFSVVGDDEPVPLLQRPAILEIQHDSDARRMVRRFAENIAEIMERMDPIFALLRPAAKTEPEIARLLERLLRGRLDGMSFFIGQIQRIGGLHPGLDPTQAVHTVWTVSSAEVHHLLTVDLGYSNEQYMDWLADAIQRLLMS